MKGMNEKKTKQKILAAYFNKLYGEFLFSGTLSIEAALVSSGINKGDYVILPNNICYRVLLSVLRLQAIPIIIEPKNRLFLTVDDVGDILNKYKVKALILVHNFGLPVDVKSFKQLYGNSISIIEDASQAWDLRSNGAPIGIYADYVVTSFGITKPLSFGIGGALFSNDEKFKSFLDYGNKESRDNKDVSLPYVLPESVKLDIMQLVKKASLLVKKQRAIARILIEKFDNSEVSFWKPEQGDDPSWNRFPIWFKSMSLYQDFLVSLTKYNIVYELPHRRSLCDLPWSLKYKNLQINNSLDDVYRINIKTRSNSIGNIKNWIKRI